MTIEAHGEAIVRGVLDQWKAGIESRKPQDVAALFTADAVFQGGHAYSTGQKGVADYYASQPIGLEAHYRLLETRQVADDVVVGFLHVDFTFTDRPVMPVKLVVVLKRSGNDWRIAHYQISGVTLPA